MTTYAVFDEWDDLLFGPKSSRTANVGSVTFAVVTLTGIGTITSGPGITDPPPAASVGYLWPRGDGTPAAT